MGVQNFISFFKILRLIVLYLKLVAGDIGSSGRKNVLELEAHLKLFITIKRLIYVKMD